MLKSTLHAHRAHTLCSDRFDIDVDERPLEERLGKYARDHLILRDEVEHEMHGFYV